ncbi:MAG: hypothetical protein PVH88_00615 [Ignavibacteria bacterium]|jgi:tetratricopeptide (TPR) repeat protein
MKAGINIFLILFIFGIYLNGQTKNLKEEAIELGKKGNYVQAIEILEKAKAETPDDPEVYYYLGFFAHYLAYDSRPLVGYSIEYSNKVLEYFYKAIELKPDYGDAYYFIGSEYGARASKALQDEDIESYKLAYKKSFESNALPVWLIEYGKNILKSCDNNGILFVGGDAEYNSVIYLQTIEKYREDITVIPFAFLNRPWFVEKLHDGVEGLLKPVPLSLTKKQILDMHPYKWKTLILEIQISNELKKEFDLPMTETIKWEINPDFETDGRSFLDASRAVLINIVESNNWKRPICFSLGCNPSFYSGLNEYLQLSGLTYKLLPLNPEGTKYKINSDKISGILLNEDNIKYFNDVSKHNMPRVSNILLNYHIVLYKLALYYKEQNQPDRIIKLIEYMKKNLLTDILPRGKNIIKGMEELVNR